MFDEPELHLLRDILTNPESPGPRNAYADWLKSQGDVREQAVRLGVKLKTLEKELFDVDFDPRFQEMQRELRNLNLDYSAKCRKHLPQFDGVKWRGFEGGVIEQVLVEDAKAFRECAAEIIKVQPVHRLEFSSDDDDDYHTLLDAPDLAQLGALTMGHNYNGPPVAAAVSRSPHLQNLRCLDLAFTSIGDQGATLLAEAKHLATLSQLVLERNELTDHGLRALCAAPQFAQVERLILGWNDLGPDAAEILAENPLTNLRYLDLHSNDQMDQTAVAGLAESGRWENLAWLNLAHCNLDSAVVETVLGGACPNLASVNLVGNRAREAACRSLATSTMPKFRDLRLELYGKLDDRVGEDFAKATWIGQLERLTIHDHGALQTLASSLAQAPLEQLSELHWLSSGKTAWSRPLDDAIALLAKNSRMSNLRDLTLHVPLTRQSVLPLSKLTSLERLAIPNEIGSYAEELTAALPSCEVSTTSFTR